ncbi:hypothetical protein [Micromonospora wenchangensis]|uniref:hypothetical protein n=1 Tax=Micromonospora wenchangensis TaxID=1185415 RepID=UPI003D70E7E1
MASVQFLIATANPSPRLVLDQAAFLDLAFLGNGAHVDRHGGGCEPSITGLPSGVDPQSASESLQASILDESPDPPLIHLEQIFSVMVKTVANNAQVDR